MWLVFHNPNGQRGCGRVALPLPRATTVSGLSSDRAHNPRVARSWQHRCWAVLRNPFGLRRPPIWKSVKPGLIEREEDLMGGGKIHPLKTELCDKRRA